jgi:hypothetical protein
LPRLLTQPDPVFFGVGEDLTIGLDDLDLGHDERVIQAAPMSELGGAVEPRQLLSKPAAVAVMRGGVEAIWIVARRDLCL